MKYNSEEIEDLKRIILQTQEDINNKKRIVAEHSNDFETWLNYSIPDERCVYPSILGINTAIGRLFHNNLQWLSNEEYKYMKFDIDFILDSVSNLIEDGVKIDVEEIKQEIIELNFGCMINKW